MRKNPPGWCPSIEPPRCWVSGAVRPGGWSRRRRSAASRSAGDGSSTCGTSTGSLSSSTRQEHEHDAPRLGIIVCGPWICRGAHRVAKKQTTSAAGFASAPGGDGCGPKRPSAKPSRAKLVGKATRTGDPTAAPKPAAEVVRVPPPVHVPPAPPHPGPQCRRCACRHLPVIRTVRRGDKIVRLRECRHCGTRMRTTEEIKGVVVPPPMREPGDPPPRRRKRPDGTYR